MAKKRFYRRKSKKTYKSAKKKRRFSAPEKVAWDLSGRFAYHMASKYGLSDDEAYRNHKKHFGQAMRDKDFFSGLCSEYGGR